MKIISNKQYLESWNFQGCSDCERGLGDIVEERVRNFICSELYIRTSKKYHGSIQLARGSEICCWVSCGLSVMREMYILYSRTLSLLFLLFCLSATLFASGFSLSLLHTAELHTPFCGMDERRARNLHALILYSNTLLKGWFRLPRIFFQLLA